MVELMRRVAPGLPVHGSTQMSITSGEGAAWVAGLGVERVVVGRELSVREIAKVRRGVVGGREGGRWGGGLGWEARGRLEGGMRERGGCGKSGEVTRERAQQWRPGALTGGEA